MVTQVCVDSSLAIMLVVPEELSSVATPLWESWLKRGLKPVAPPLFFAEVTSVLRENIFFDRVPPEEAERAFDAFRRLRVMQVDPEDLQPRAWALAKTYNQHRAYDAQYLAVASALGCDLWTADRRLVHAVNEPWVRWVGDYTGLK